jgi:hypothetical protein
MGMSTSVLIFAAATVTVAVTVGVTFAVQACLTTTSFS